MMRHAPALGTGRLGGADIHPAIELARVGVDNFATDALGDFQRERGLARSRGAGNESGANPRRLGGRCRRRAFGFNRLRIHRRNIRSIWPRGKLICTGRPCGQLVLNSVRSSSASSAWISAASSARPTRIDPWQARLLSRSSKAAPPPPNAALPDRVDHVGKQLGAPFGTEHRGCALEQRSSLGRTAPGRSPSRAIAGARLHRGGTGGIQLDGHGREHRLHADAAAGKFAAQFLEGDALVRGVLIDKQHPVVTFQRDISGK